MHIDEITISVAQVRGLIDEQFPQWAGLSVTPVASAGTDNLLFRLGDALCLRLPRTQERSKHLRKEISILPRLRGLPLRIPKLVGTGKPNQDYPCEWAVLEWIEGTCLSDQNDFDRVRFIDDIAGFVRALQNLPTEGGPYAGSHNNNRGVPPAQQDVAVRAAIENLSAVYETHQLFAFWESALSIPTWQNPPVWLHGDIHRGNLLVKDGHLCAVIDFGLCGLGDPACDFMLAWTELNAEERLRFRNAIKPEQATWLRGRAWAFCWAVNALAYYINTNPFLARMSRRTIDAVLAEVAQA